MDNIKTHFLVLLATLLVAGSFLVSEKLASTINSYSLTLLRFLGASFILFPFILYKARWRNKILPTMPRALLISVFYTAFFIGLFESLNTTSSLNTAAIFTLVPLIIAIISGIIFKDKISTKHLLIYILGVIGTVWVVFGGDLNLLFSLSLKEGDYIFLIAIIFMSLYSIMMKLLYRNDEMIVLVFCTLLGGSFWMAVVLLFSDIPLQWSELNSESWLYMSYLIIGATLATVYLYQVTTISIGPSRVNSYIYLNPGLVAILLLIVNGITIPTIVIPGIVITLIATFALQIKKA